MVQNFMDFLLNAPLWHPGKIALLIGTGTLVGFVNTIAGMATAITYALFMAMGLPINVANGTTRIGVVSQFAVNSLIFKKKGYLDIKQAGKVGIPVAIGSFIGAEMAAIMDPMVMEWAMGILLPVMAIMLFFDTKQISEKFSNGGVTSNMNIGKFIAFIIIGIYGGFTHAGVGLLIMFGSFYMLGLDLIRSNGIKQFAVLIYTPIALIIFIAHGQINWPIALIYAIGNVCGGIIGSKVAIKWGAKFIKIAVAIVIFAMSAYLIYKQF